NGLTSRMRFCVAASRTSTVRSRFTAGKPRIFIVRSFMGHVLGAGSLAEREIDLPEECDILARLHGNRFEHHLVVELLAGEPPGLPANSLAMMPAPLRSTRLCACRRATITPWRDHTVSVRRPCILSFIDSPRQHPDQSNLEPPKGEPPNRAPSAN